MPRVSILTPSWNRAEFLPKVYEALVTQTFQDFEWIVVDDGSEDNTQVVMQELLEKSPFPITFVHYNKRVGKCRADNVLLDLAQGDKVLWNDSDDELVPDALEKMLAVWDEIPLQEQNEYINVIALCVDQDGHIQSEGFKDFIPFSSTWEDASDSYGMIGDMCFMLNRNALADARFLEVDLVMSESGFWTQFREKKVRCLPDPLKVVTRTTENRISGSSRMEYCRGKAYAILLADKDRYQKMSLKRQIRIASNLIRYSIHGDLAIKKVKREFGLGSSYLTFRLGNVFGRILALKDKLQGRVYKSHLIFEEGRDAVSTVVKSQSGVNR